jgi:hypothetical protein
MAVPSPDLFRGDRSCSIPKGIAAMVLEPVLGTHSQDGQQQFGG